MRKLLILLILLLAIPASAQWRRAGLHGADVRALIVDQQSPDTFYLGTSSGDVYVSTDGAKSWVAPRSTPFPNFVVDNLLLDRKGRLWAAAWGLWGGGVVAVSEDGGRTWARRDKGLEDFSVRAIAVDRRNPDFVVVGGLTGVYSSTDSGRSWNKISDQINVESLAIDPRSSERIYVGTWRQGWRTDDGGKTWKHIAEGMVLDTDMFSITIDPKNADNVWVATCGWVYNSLNGGDKWTRYREGFNNRRIHAVEIDPLDSNVVYAGSVAGLYRSTDAGKVFGLVTDESLVINSIVLHPDRPGRIVLGIEGDGVYLSHDKGKTFERTSDGLHDLRITTIAPDPFEKNRVYAAVAFGGSASGIYRSDDGGTTWARASTTPLPEVLSLTIASEANAPVKFIAGTEKGFFHSSDAVEWTQAEPSGFPIRVARVIRFNSTRMFAATSEGVFTSRDGGLVWYRLGGQTRRAVDIAVGRLSGDRALFALTEAGLEVFNGTAWSQVSGAPERGRTIAVRSVAGNDVVFVAGAHGVKAGSIVKGSWEPIAAPDAQYAVVHGGSRSTGQMLFLSSRAQREILVGEANDAYWSELTMPVQNAEVTAVVPDPFIPERYFVGTLGDGVFVYEGKMRRHVVREASKGAQAATGAR